MADLDEIARIALREVMTQREEILKAFVAKYGYQPERCVQIIQENPGGGYRWFIRRFTDEEMKEKSLVGASL